MSLNTKTLLNRFKMAQVKIYQIDLQNGNSTKSLKTFECCKVMPEFDLVPYKLRVKSVFERRLKRKITVILRHVPAESKYDERFEKEQEALNSKRVTVYEP
jgi:hypothetical protein